MRSRPVSRLSCGDGAETWTRSRSCGTIWCTNGTCRPGRRPYCRPWPPDSRPSLPAFPHEAAPDRPARDFPAPLEFLEEDLRVVVRNAEDCGHLSGRASPEALKDRRNRGFGRVEGLRHEVRVDLPEDVLEHLPGLPSVQPGRHVAPTDFDCRETGDFEAFAFLAVLSKRLFRGPVVQRVREGVDIESDGPRDVRLDGAPVDPSSLDAPRLAQRPQIPSADIDPLEFRGFRGDAGGPCRCEVVRRLEHLARIHRHPVLCRDRLEERDDGGVPLPSGHPGPLLPHRREILEESAHPDGHADGVRVDHLEAAHHRLAAPAPYVVGIRVPDDSEGRRHMPASLAGAQRPRKKFSVLEATTGFDSVRRAPAPLPSGLLAYPRAFPPRLR